MANDIRWRLRDITQTDHQRLEDRLDIFTRISTPAGRQDLVTRFHSLHEGAEAVLAPHLDGLEDLGFAGRRRTPRLCADLATLGVSPSPAATVAACRDRGEALGFLYVLEGSTLGGKVIGRRVEQGGGSMAGLSFLDPYGDAAAAQWRGFLAVLEREAADPLVADSAVAGALSGFRHSEAVLCPRDVAAA